MLRPTCEAVVIGASAGAIEALGQILPTFPATMNVAVMVVVHLPLRKPSLLPELFAPRCAMAVQEPHDKELVRPGTIWFAPADYHLLVEADRTFAFCSDAPVHHSRPAIDVLFESAADVYGDTLVAVVLTGASRDGAAGAAAVRHHGGLVAVQDPATADSALMPTASIEQANPHCVGSLHDIAGFVRKAAGAE